MPLSLAFCLYNQRDAHIRVLPSLFSNKKVAVTLFSADQFLQSVLGHNSRSRQTLFQALTICTAYQALLLLYPPSVVCSRANTKSMKVNMSNTMENVVGLVEKTVSRARRNHFQKVSLPPVLKALAL